MRTGVLRQLIKAGVPLEEIPQEWVDVILAGSLKWMMSTLEGVEETLGRLKFELYHADSSKEYVVIDDHEKYAKTVSSDDLYFVRGVIAGGEPISPKQLNISDKDKSQCDDCGVVAHCLLDVRDPRSDRIKSLCNFCVAYHENPRVNDRASKETCRTCTVITCFNNDASRLGQKYQA